MENTESLMAESSERKTIEEKKINSRMRLEVTANIEEQWQGLQLHVSQRRRRGRQWDDEHEDDNEEGRHKLEHRDSNDVVLNDNHDLHNILLLNVARTFTWYLLTSQRVLAIYGLSNVPLYHL